MDLVEAIRTRRSIRRYEDREVPTELLLKAIGEACWAPNGGNFQPWKFYVVKNKELIVRIADAVQAKNDLIGSWPEAEEVGHAAKRYQRTSSFFRSAPAVIALAMAGYQSPQDAILKKRGDSDPAAREMIENRAAISSRTQTIAGAAAYLLLVLHELGLGACWMAGPMLAKREIEQMLEVPAPLEMFALISVGFPAETPAPAPRKPLEEVTRVFE